MNQNQFWSQSNRSLITNLNKINIPRFKQTLGESKGCFKRKLHFKGLGAPQTKVTGVVEQLMAQNRKIEVLVNPFQKND